MVVHSKVKVKVKVGRAWGARAWERERRTTTGVDKEKREKAKDLN